MDSTPLHADTPHGQPTTTGGRFSPDVLVSSGMSQAGSTLRVDVHQLLERAVANDGRAWKELQEDIVPSLERWARRHSGMRRRKLSGSVDDVREVVTATLERLQVEHFANLRKYLATGEDAATRPTLEGWLFGAVDFSVREHLRARFGRRSSRAPAEHSGSSIPVPSKRDLNTLAARFDEQALPGAQGSITWQFTFRQVMAYVRDSFAPTEAHAMRMYLEQSANYDDLARVLGLASAGEAERLIRKLKERLRTRFKPEEA